MNGAVRCNKKNKMENLSKKNEIGSTQIKGQKKEYERELKTKRTEATEKGTKEIVKKERK